LIRPVSYRFLQSRKEYDWVLICEPQQTVDSESGNFVFSKITVARWGDWYVKSLSFRNAYDPVKTFRDIIQNWSEDNLFPNSGSISNAGGQLRNVYGPSEKEAEEHRRKALKIFRQIAKDVRSVMIGETDEIREASVRFKNETRNITIISRRLEDIMLFSDPSLFLLGTINEVTPRDEIMEIADLKSSRRKLLHPLLPQEKILNEILLWQKNDNPDNIRVSDSVSARDSLLTVDIFPRNQIKIRTHIDRAFKMAEDSPVNVDITASNCLLLLSDSDGMHIISEPSAQTELNISCLLQTMNN
jgi:hypothetical protein